MGCCPAASLTVTSAQYRRNEAVCCTFWHVMDQRVTDKAVDKWRGHLHACVRQKVDTEQLL